MKLAGFVIGSLAMLATTAFAAEYKFKLAHEVAVESTQHLAATKFAELVKERTNGDIEIKVFPEQRARHRTTGAESVAGRNYRDRAIRVDHLQRPRR